MKRILVIDGHPDPARTHFIHAAADAYAAGASEAHEVRRIEVAQLDFPILRIADEWEKGSPPPDIAAAQELVRWAEHVAIFYPLWLGDVPALLKAFFEQVARPGFAFRYREKGLPLKLLKGKSARVVVSMGMPAPFYRIFYRAHSVKSLERNILAFVGFGPVRHSIIGSIDANAPYRARWLTRLRTMGTKAV